MSVQPEAEEVIETGDNRGDAANPDLRKSSSDGIYCSFVQRRISHHLSAWGARRGISANFATGIGLLFAVLASLFLFLGYPVVGVVFIQLFGIMSCVDGEIARLTNGTSRLGDLYDTMVDRIAEFLIVGALMLSMHAVGDDVRWEAIFFGYMGMVFLITASSEKYRSVFHENYPKRDAEFLFCWLCASSDTRLFYISLGVIAHVISGRACLIKWLIVTQSVLLVLNILFRLWKIPRLIEAKDSKST